MCNSSFQVWSLWGCKTMFLVREPVYQINGVPVPAERSWSSLKGVLHISKEMVSFKGLLHMFKTLCNFQKRQLIQFSFWWVKPFLQTNCAPSKEIAAGFRWKGVVHVVWRNGATFKHKGQQSCFCLNATSLEDTLHILTQYCVSSLN